MPVYSIGGPARVKHARTGETYDLDFGDFEGEEPIMWLAHPQLGMLQWVFDGEMFSTGHKVRLGGHQLVADFEFGWDEGPGTIDRSR